MTKKLLFITTRIPWPVDSGRKQSLYHYCRGLHEQYGYEVDLYVFPEGDQDFQALEEIKPDFIRNMYLASEISVTEIIRNLFLKSLFCREWPLQCALYYSEKNSRRIQELCQKEHYEAAITDMVRMAPYFHSMDTVAKKILDMDDLLSLRYQRELSITGSSNFAGQYSKKMPAFLKRLLPILKKPVLHFESRRIQYAEIFYSRLYDSVILVSGKEADELNQRLGTNQCVVVPVGIDSDFFSRKSGASPQKGSLSFVGNLEYAPNAASLRMIVQEVLPYVNQDVVLYVIGKTPENIQREFSGQIRFSGRVEDVREYVQSTELFLAPIAYGSGIKTKILEAMAMGIPVLTNTLGAEGLPVKSGVHMIISDDMKTLARHVDKLFRDTEERERIGKNGQKFVQEHYDWAIVWKNFSACGL